MVRILTGVCCAVWCAAILVQTLQLGAAFESSFAAAACFTEEMPGEVTAILRLSGSCREQLPEEEVPQFLENAAAALGIQGGYGIFEKQEEYGLVWELSGADDEMSYSLKYLDKEEDTGFISWKLTGDWSQRMQEIYSSKERLEQYCQPQTAVCLALRGAWDRRLTTEEICASAEKLMEQIGADIVYEGAQDNLQLYYGYGEELGECIQFDGKKANVNLMYRVSDTQTRCTIGFPAVQWDE